MSTADAESTSRTPASVAGDLTAGRVRSLTSRQVENRLRKIDQALDLLDTLWRDHHPQGYERARTRSGFIGQARTAVNDLRRVK